MYTSTKVTILYPQTFVFASGGPYGSHSAFRCVQGAKCWCTISHARLGPIRIPRKARCDTIRQICVFHLVGSIGHVVHFSASRMRNIDGLFFMLRKDRYGYPKSAPGHITPNLCFCSLWDLWVML
jgi:hypothetical protein